MTKFEVYFKVQNNYGETFVSKKYKWDKEKGIPNEETVLEDMEKCNSMSCNTETQGYCDCSSEFDEGKVLEIVNCYEHRVREAMLQLRVAFCNNKCKEFETQICCCENCMIIKECERNLGLDKEEKQ